jgi:hypothetical protein
VAQERNAANHPGKEHDGGGQMGVPPQEGFNEQSEDSRREKHAQHVIRWGGSVQAVKGHGSASGEKGW